jgi:hypothetical protein
VTAAGISVGQEDRAVVKVFTEEAEDIVAVRASTKGVAEDTVAVRASTKGAAADIAVVKVATKAAEAGIVVGEADRMGEDIHATDKSANSILLALAT